MKLITQSGYGGIICGGYNMKDYTKMLPKHRERFIGENDLFLEIFKGKEEKGKERPPLLLVHGAYTGSWMWSKFIPHFLSDGWNCYVMNLRSHYRSRVMDMTRVSFEDYLEDIKEIIAECGEPPVLIGFSMGGILCQKIAETQKLSGLIVIDSSISKQVHQKVPYKDLEAATWGNVAPAPGREEISSIDESPEDIAFQKKYLSMESSRTLLKCSISFGAREGISIDSSLITCPCLVIKAVGSEEDETRGKAEAEHLNAEYKGFEKTTHTGLLIGQRYNEVVERIIGWLEKF
jgi:pimeloyl-ACP methyl ester carboxylesterase